MAALECARRSSRRCGRSAARPRNTAPTACRPRSVTSPAPSTTISPSTKMDYDPEKGPALLELANRFQDKSFLPIFGYIRNFCQVYGIDVPASKSRASAIPRSSSS